MFPNYHSFTFVLNVVIFYGTMDNITYIMDQIEEGRIRIVLSKDGVELGSLYFERAKKGFNRKPVGMNAWACVDAKIERLYEVEKNITPTEVMSHCQSLIRGAGL